MSQTFGRYEVIRELGRGAMGVVYLAGDPLLHRQVAIKTVEVAGDNDSEREFLRDRLLRDARAAAVLKHPHIVAVHDICEEGGRAYLVMEYVEGESLAAMLQANPLPGADVILRVISQAAAALDYTHSRGVVHRDIKPANIMIDPAGTARIMDFGIARIADTRTSTPTGMVMGTAEYMSPEQIRGEPLDGRADQFSLGVVAYQMMTGGTLFGAQALATLTYKIVHETPPPPTTRNPLLPRTVDEVIARALCKTPAGRFASCSEFAGALGRAFDTPSTRATVPPARRRRPPAALLAAVALLLVLGSALAVWRTWRGSHTPAQVVSVAAPPAPAPQALPPPPEEKAATAAVSPALSAPGKPVPKPPEKTVRNVPPPKAVVSRVAPPPEPAEDLVVPPPEPVGGKGDATAPGPFAVTMKRGLDLLNARDFAGAEQAFQKAVTLRPRAPHAFYNLGAAQQNLQENDAAVRSYSEAIRLAPETAMAYAERGVCLVRLHRDPDALIDFQRALELKPAMPVALNGRGGVYLRRKQFQLALADFNAAIAGNPNQPQVYANRARAREAMGDSRGAADDRRREADLRRK